jgi:hypothetical protein
MASLTSGNTWLRHMIQQGTRVWTGSVYCDTNLRDNGFPAECTDLNVIPHARMSALKSHEAYTNMGYGKFRPSIVLLRNPFDAFIAEWKRVVGQSHEADLPYEQLFGDTASWKAAIRSFFIPKFLAFCFGFGAMLSTDAAVELEDFQSIKRSRGLWFVDDLGWFVLDPHAESRLDVWEQRPPYHLVSYEQLKHNPVSTCTARLLALLPSDKSHGNDEASSANHPSKRCSNP